MSEKRTLIYEVTMIILALISIVMVILDYMGKIVIGTNPYIYISGAILIIFVIDYLHRFVKAKHKRRFFKDNIVDLLGIMPFNEAFTFFRIFRLLRLGKVFKIIGWTRTAKFFSGIRKEMRSLMRINGLIYLLYTSLGIIVVSSAIYSYAEHESMIESFWWAATTVTTVGYGDVAPHTMAGKLAAILLMFVGIGFIGMLTSSITNYFTDGTDSDKIDEVLKELKAIQEQNEKLTTQIESLEERITKKDAK